MDATLVPPVIHNVKLGCKYTDTYLRFIMSCAQPYPKDDPYEPLTNEQLYVEAIMANPERQNELVELHGPYYKKFKKALDDHDIDALVHEDPDEGFLPFQRLGIFYIFKDIRTIRERKIVEEKDGEVKPVFITCSDEEDFWNWTDSLVSTFRLIDACGNNRSDLENLGSSIMQKLQMNHTLDGLDVRSSAGIATIFDNVREELLDGGDTCNDIMKLFKKMSKDETSGEAIKNFFTNGDDSAFSEFEQMASTMEQSIQPTMTMENKKDDDDGVVVEDKECINDNKEQAIKKMMIDETKIQTMMNSILCKVRLLGTVSLGKDKQKDLIKNLSAMMMK